MLAMIEYGTVSLDGASMERNAGSMRSCDAAALLIPKDCDGNDCMPKLLATLAQIWRVYCMTLVTQEPTKLVILVRT